MGVSAPWCPRDLPHVFPWEEGWSIPLSKGRLWNTAAAIRSSSSFPPSVTLSYGSFPRASICNHLCDSGMQTARTRKQPSFLETSAQACPSVELWLILLWEKKKKKTRQKPTCMHTVKERAHVRKARSEQGEELHPPGTRSSSASAKIHSIHRRFRGKKGVCQSYHLGTVVA